MPFEKKLEYPKLKETDRFYHGQYSTYLTVLDTSDLAELEGKFKLRLTSSKDGGFLSFNIDIAKKCKIIEGDSLFKLIANIAMDDLINTDKFEEATDLSIKYQTPCQLTSFFATEESLDPIENTYKYKQYNKSTPNSDCQYEPDGICLHLRTMEGHTLYIEVDPNISIDDLKLKIEEKTGISASVQSISSAGRIINDGCI